MKLATTLFVLGVIAVCLALAILLAKIILKIVATAKSEKKNETDSTPAPVDTKDGDNKSAAETVENGESTTSNEAEKAADPAPVDEKPCPEKGALAKAEAAKAAAAKNSEEIDKIREELAAEKAAREKREAEEAEEKNAPRKNELDAIITANKVALVAEEAALKGYWSDYLSLSQKNAGDRRVLSNLNGKSVRAETAVRVTAFQEVGTSKVAYNEKVASKERVGSVDLAEAGDAVEAADNAVNDRCLEHQDVAVERIRQEMLVEADADKLKALKENLTASIGKICIISNKLKAALNEWADLSTSAKRHREEKTILDEIKALDELIEEIGKI